ncbi:MAG: hypothetical protein ABIJ97_12050 [Bacteroidota bacterium]
MTSSFSKYLKITLGAFMLITIVMFAMLYLGGNAEGNSDIPKYTNSVLYLAYIFFAIAAILAVVFPIFSLVSQPKSAFSAIIGIVAVGLIVLIGYLLSDGTLIKMPSTYTGLDNNPSTLKMTDAGLYTMYILLFLAILGILITAVLNAFKK